jgi:NAD(P)H dehydrogenase (quinone)
VRNGAWRSLAARVLWEHEVPGSNPGAPTMGLIAVTGATGGIGGRVAATLADRGLEQRLVVRDASRAPSLGADVAEATYADGDAMRAALDGVETLFLVSGAEARERVKEHFTAVDAAAAAGVARVVYLSFMGAAPDAVFTFARDHHATEERIRATGAEHTFLRSCMYADYVPVFAGEDGVIRGPAGQGRAAFVARDDVAEVAAAVVADGAGHSGKTYDMTGPEALSLSDAAALVSRAAGREVVYEEETLEQARESRRPSGHPDWEIEGWVTSYAAIAAGTLETVSDTVERITARPPRSLADFLREHPESYRHLTG